uniref:Proline-rich protein n=1 Tax=Fagus sylvatica TaxID=28930 RepID=A0A2N9FKI4_FAGSY
MRILPLLCFWVSLVFAASLCYGDDKTVEVVGFGECADCEQSNIKTKHAFSGLRVTIDCKPENGHFKTRGVGELDEEGKFKVSVHHKIVKDGQLNEECYAQLHSASAAPCPTHNGLESSKLSCGLTYKYPPPPKLSPLPKFPHPNLKNFGHPFHFPPKVFPPLPPKFTIYNSKSHFPPPIPIYKEAHFHQPLYHQYLLQEATSTTSSYLQELPPLIPSTRSPSTTTIAASLRTLIQEATSTTSSYLQEATSLRQSPIIKKPLPPPFLLQEATSTTSSFLQSHFHHQFPTGATPPVPTRSHFQPLPPPVPISTNFHQPVYKLPPVPLQEPFQSYLHQQEASTSSYIQEAASTTYTYIQEASSTTNSYLQETTSSTTIPVFKKPFPPIPIQELPPPKKPLPPPVPIFKKPLPPPVPIFKKPFLPPIPIYKPKPPIFHKPLPPFPKIPPFFKKPWPPIPTTPLLPKLPPIPKLHPKYFPHPKFKKFPPLPPIPSHP